MLTQLKSWLGFETRPPKASDVSPEYRYVPNYSGKISNSNLLEAYPDAPWLRGPMGKLARDVGGVFWTMYRRPDRSSIDTRMTRDVRFLSREKSVQQALNRKDLVEVPHVLLDMLQEGSDMLSGPSTVVVGVLNYLITGEFLFLVERDDMGNPLQLFAVPTTWVQSLPAAGRPWYTINFPDKTLNVPMEHVIHDRDPHPADPYGRGIGIARALGDEIDADEFAAAHTKAYFYNNSTPSLLVGVENASQDQLRHMHERWEAENRGVFNGFRTHFYSGKVAAQQLSRTFRENQTLDLRLFNRNTVMQVLGMPPEIMGVLENSNRSTITQAELFYTRRTLQGLVEVFRTAFQKFLDREWPDTYLLHYHSVVPDDLEFVLKVAQAAPQTRTVNEWRALQNLPPVPGGDEMYNPATYSNQDDQEKPDADAEDDGDSEEG